MVILVISFMIGAGMVVGMYTDGQYAKAQETIDITNPALPQPVQRHDIAEHLNFLPVSVALESLYTTKHSQAFILYSDGSKLCTINIPGGDTTYFLFGETVTVAHGGCPDKYKVDRVIHLATEQDEVFHQGDVLVLTRIHNYTEVYREQTHNE